MRSRRFLRLLIESSYAGRSCGKTAAQPSLPVEIETLDLRRTVDSWKEKNLQVLKSGKHTGSFSLKMSVWKWRAKKWVNRRDSGEVEVKKDGTRWMRSRRDSDGQTTTWSINQLANQFLNQYVSQSINQWIKFSNSSLTPFVGLLKDLLATRKSLILFAALLSRHVPI